MMQVDEMGGYQKEEPVSDGITAGDLSELIGPNRVYYMNVFDAIITTSILYHQYSCDTSSGSNLR